MTFAFGPPTDVVPAPEALVVDAVRFWRETRDRQRPVLPLLFARLETRQAGFLAPALNALLAMLENWSGRRFRAGALAAPELTADERRLLALLTASAPATDPNPARPGLTAPLRIALGSTRILLRRVLGRDIDGSPPPGNEAAIFFTLDSERQQDRAPALPAQTSAASVQSQVAQS